MQAFRRKIHLQRHHEVRARGGWAWETGARAGPLRAAAWQAGEAARRRGSELASLPLDARLLTCRRALSPPSGTESSSDAELGARPYSITFGLRPTLPPAATSTTSMISPSMRTGRTRRQAYLEPGRVGTPEAISGDIPV